jgi:hypothetical protein
MILTFSFTVVHAQYKVWTVDMATIYDNAVNIAKEKAIDNAQRKAVEEKVGLMIIGATEVENL